MATHSSILAWKIPCMEEPGRLQSMGSPRLRFDWVISLHFTSLLKDVLMLLCYIRTLWVQCAGIFLINSFPTSDSGFTHLFNFCSSFFSLYHCIPRHTCHQWLSLSLSNNCHLTTCSAYSIANVSKPTRMWRPAHLEN